MNGRWAHRSVGTTHCVRVEARHATRGRVEPFLFDSLPLSPSPNSSHLSPRLTYSALPEPSPHTHTMLSYRIIPITATLDPNRVPKISRSDPCDDFPEPPSPPPGRQQISEVR